MSLGAASARDLSARPVSLSGKRELLGVVATGIAAGLVASWIADLKTTWIAFLLAAAFLGVVLLAIADVQRFVATAFVLSLQADAAYRLLYGHAGSEGVPFPLCVLIGATWVALAFVFGRERRVASNESRPLSWAIAVILGSAFVSWLLSSEHFIGMTALLTQLQLAFIFWLAVQMVRSQEQFERTVRLLLVMLAMQCVVYFIQSALGISFTLEGDTIEQGVVPRPGGTVSSNPAGFASFIMPILMIAMARFLSTSARIERHVLTALVVAGVVAIGLTFTRVAWAGLVFGMIWLGWTMLQRGQFPKRLVWVLGALAVAAVALTPAMLMRVEDSPLEDAYAERSGLMDIAFEIIRANPITGIGPGAYGYVYKRYLPENMPDQWLFTVHNEYLLRTAETGILGGAAWVALLVCGFRLAQQVSRQASFSTRTFGLGWSAGLLALAWQMYWVPWDGFQYNAMLWFLLGLSVAALRIAREETNVKPAVVPR